MYPAKGDDRSSTSTISRSSSSDSGFDDDSGHAAAVQLPSLDDDKQRSSKPCPGRSPCASGGRRMAVLALVCAIAAAAGVSRCGGCLVGLRKANGGSTSCPRGNKREEAEANASLEVESSLQAGIRPWHRKGILGKVREGHDDWRRRRKLKLELESNGRDSEAGSKDRTKRKPSSSSSSSDNRSDGRRLLQQARGMFVASPEAAKRRAKDDAGGAEEVHSRKPPKGRKAASRQEKATEGGTAKGKRRALQALWGRVVARLGGGRGGGGRNGDRAGEEDARRAGLLKELRRKVEERYGSELWGRAKAAGHELDDELLMRYLEMAYWTMESMGQPLPDAVASTVRWREDATPHLLTDEQVAEEAKYGKMYVRGFDRQQRPIIHYRPGLEKSFDTEKGLNLLFHTLEKAKGSLPKGQTQFAVVADCAGFGPSKTPPLPMLKTAFITMQRHYPMRLGYVVIVNAGGPITFVWKLISTVLEERTKDKIAFVSKKEAEATLTGLIDPSALPASLPGGLDDFTYSNEEYLNL
ncbi:unnamed protein product [Ectocarpus sp. 13 AM-2016]